MSNFFLRIFVIAACVFSYSQTSNAAPSLNCVSQNTIMKLNPGAILQFNTAQTGFKGQLDEQSGANVRGESITFTSNSLGSMNIADTTIELSSAYNGDASQEFTIASSKLLRINTGILSKRILATGTSDCRLEGDFIFSVDDSTTTPNVELNDSTTNLTVALTNKLNSFVKMNGGTITLDSDLKFADTKYPDGLGIVDLNQNTVSFGGQDLTLTHSIHWKRSTDVVLNSRTDLHGTWTFEGVGNPKVATLQGNGNVLDLNETGTIWIKDGTTLQMTDVKLKGLGLDKGSIVFEDTDSVLKLSNVVIELSANYTVTMGNVYVEGPTTIITRDKYLDFDMKGSLSVDGQTMYYDTLGYEDNGNIRFGHVGLSDPAFDSNNNAANLYLDTGSQIVRKEIEELGDIYWGGTGGNQWPASATVTLKKDMYVCTDRKLYVQDNRAMTLEGHGCALEFSKDDGIINIASGSSIAFQNIVLRNFSPQHITGSGSYTFGNDVIIELAPTDTDIATNKSVIPLTTGWDFNTASGKFLIDCKGNILQIGSGGSIYISGDGGELTIQNGTIQSLSTHADLYCEKTIDTINLKDMTLLLDGNFTVTQGIFNFYNNVVVKGLTATSSDHIFTWATGTTSSQIKTDASLTFDHNVTFSYASTAPSKVGITMADETAALVFNGSALHSTLTGLRLATGNLFIDNRVTFTSEGRNTGEAIELGSNLNVEMLSGALLDVYGRIITD